MHSPALSTPYSRAGRFSVKGYSTMAAGTLEMIWLSRMPHQYSRPRTALCRNAEMAGLAETEEEKMKKQRNVIRST